MIEWLMQVVAVAWMGTLLVTLLKVLDDDAGDLPTVGRDRDSPPPVCRRLDVGRRSIGGSIGSARDIRSKPRAHRGNARKLRAAPRYARHPSSAEKANPRRRR
jgi:hypothetical protein